MVCMRTSSATLNAASTGNFGTSSSNLSFGMTIVVSHNRLNLSRPSRAFSILTSPSALNGSVTTPIVSAFCSLASRAA